MPLNTAKIDDFSGGINAIDDPTDFEANELDWIATQDVEFVGHGKGIRTRRLHKLETTGLITPTGQTNWIASMMSMRAASSNVDSIILSSYGGRVDVYSPAAGTVTNRLAAAGGTDKLWFFEQMADVAGVQKCYMVNGVSTPQFYNIDTPAATANWPGAPPNGTCLKSWKLMMMVAGVAAQPQRLYYSKINDPETFTAPGGFIDIKSTDDENDKIIGLEVIGENLLVFKQNSVWLVFDSITFENRRIANFGLTNAHAKCIQGDRVYFCTTEGVYSTDGETVKNESLNLQAPDGPFAGHGFQTARMAALPDGKVIMGFGHGFTQGWWILETRIQRPDKQYAWLFHQVTARYASAMCTATVAVGINPVKLLFFVWNDQLSNQYLYRAFSYTSVALADENQFATVQGMFQTRRMALQGTENIERIRRINVWGQKQATGTFNLSIVDEQNNAVYSANLALPTANLGFARCRPEVRTRFMSIWVVMQGNGHECAEIEIKYRGGKEH